MATEYKSSLTDLARRRDLLADRLQISTKQSAAKIWEKIGQVLAHKEKEFKDFEFLDGERRTRGRGRPTTRVPPDLIFASNVDEHSQNNPHLKTDLEALEDMQRRGLLSATTEISSYQSRLSKGRKIIREIQEERDATSKARVAAERETAANLKANPMPRRRKQSQS